MPYPPVTDTCVRACAYPGPSPQWLPTVRCVFYVGAREERARLFATDVAPALFNVLVTTYEFIMRDRSKLSKLDWKYIIIDEAQRLK
eukprot:316892-Chlamydomonas_euryale.AAC.5